MTEPGTPPPEEQEFLDALRRLTPQAPSSRLENRIFRRRRFRLLREPSWAAALLLFALSLAALFFQERSRLPEDARIGDCLIRSSAYRPGLEMFERRDRLFTGDEK